MRSFSSIAAAGMLATVLARQVARADEVKPVVSSAIRGIHPDSSASYTSHNGQFICLDGSHTIPFNAINDDYCDCPDGSDEPGTSACEDSGVRFYCENKGHIPGWVISSRVNDGICDPECCDGSDEWATGACPDQCETIGKEHRAKHEAESKTRKTGAKIRGTYIKWALGEKRRIEEALAGKKSQVASLEAEVENARTQLQQTEARSHEQLEKRKQSPVYTSLLTHRLALTRLRSKASRLQSDLDTLHNILGELSKGYNPNYQDMAVKAAAVGYEEFLSGASGTSEADAEMAGEEIADGELDELERKDLEALLLLDDGDAENGGDGLETGLLFKIEEYIPDSLYDSYEALRDTAIDWLIRIGLIGKGGKNPTRTTSAGDGPPRQKHQDLAGSLHRLQSEISDDEDALVNMADGYGPQAEWKKLEKTCVDKVSGDYTYELCFFGSATQKSNKDSSSNYLGSFSGWKPDTAVGTFDQYTRQLYTNGAKCWNGPMRSATVDISCGTTNALISIAEPEKCEYRFKVTSPALCWPLDEDQSGSVGVKQEL